MSHRGPGPDDESALHFQAAKPHAGRARRVPFYLEFRGQSLSNTEKPVSFFLTTNG
jgi:hypothetical protein